MAAGFCTDCHLCVLVGDDTAAVEVTLAVITAEEGVDADTLRGVGCVDVVAVANVDAYMGDAVDIFTAVAGVAGDKDQVAGTKLVDADARDNAILAVLAP